MPEPDGPTGEELRARYAGQTEIVEAEPVIRLLGRDDIDPHWAIGCRYATREAFDAFAESNLRHHGHQTLGPVQDGDGTLYGLIILNREAVDHGALRRAHSPR